MKSLFIGSTALLLAASVHGQVPVWTRVATSHAPSPRDLATMAYDAARQRILLVAGNNTLACCPNTLADTWEFDGTDWTQRAVASPAVGFSWYEPTGQRVLHYESNGLQTWAWDGTAWSALGQPAGSLPTNYGAIAYDSLRQRAVLFGGADRWWLRATHYEHDGSGWALRQTGGPSPRMMHAMTYDAARGVVLLFGGRRYDGLPGQDTWEWNGSWWFEHFGIPSPPGREVPGLVFDPSRNVAVLYGGRSGPTTDLHDTWEWDGAAWTQIQSPTAPTAAHGMAMVYEPGTQSVLLFGGRANGALLDETWRLVSTNAPPASVTPYGNGCAGPAGVPSLQASGTSVPRLGHELVLTLGNLPPSPLNLPFGVLGLSDTTWNGQPLPMALDPFGFPGCVALLAPSPPTVLGNIGGTATWTLAVPPAAELLGFTFFAQAGVSVPGFNVGGVVFSNGVRCVVGI